MAKDILSKLSFTAEKFSLEDIVAWNSYSGIKESKFADKPSGDCIKIKNLSYYKFLEIFSEVCISF